MEAKKLDSAILNGRKTGVYICDACGKVAQEPPGTGAPLGWLLGVFDPSVHCSMECAKKTIRKERGE